MLLVDKPLKVSENSREFPRFLRCRKLSQELKKKKKKEQEIPKSKSTHPEAKTQELRRGPRRNIQKILPTKNVRGGRFAKANHQGKKN